ncbi:MAG: carboxypeptidase M32 [Candidatus Moranbacteria bacterium]|nr:carboxypeptidase M32 [Candidatus Moranbacteria bacterium]
MKNKVFKEFREKLLELWHLNSALAVLSWDQEVNMPENGADLRAKTIASLAGLLHGKFVSKEFSTVINKVKKFSDNGELNKKETAIFREVWREFSREEKLSSEFVEELAELCSKSQSVWSEARKKSNFKIFQPYLEKIVELKRKEAKFVGYEKSPYDALIDTYEPGMTSEELSVIFYELKIFLVDILQKIKKSKKKIDARKLKGNFPIEKQEKLNKFIAEKMGFNFESGRMDISTHPFTTNFHPDDVRITTRYDEKNLFYSVLSTIHETGHALYEQGIEMKNFGTPLGESISLGIHESQSRIWEKNIGQSQEFWKCFYPDLKKNFPDVFRKLKLVELYEVINEVKPSSIRTEADELTYNLHIILRFEIEKELIEGSIEVADLPKIWNSKMKEYLGIKILKDSQGILQDVHWSGGSIGYFPTYTLGNLYAAQLYAKIKKDIPDLKKEIENGNFENILAWLRKNIHTHGKLYTADELIRKITGETLSSKYFMDYINNKYGKIYEL